MTFSTVYLPIVNGQVTVDVGREVMRRGAVEFAVYMEGYLDGEYGVDDVFALFSDKVLAAFTGFYWRISRWMS